MSTEGSDSDDDLDAARNRRAVRGCIVAMLIPVVALIAIIAWFRWDAPRGNLPRVVRTSEVLAFESSGFFREASICGLYRLHPETVAGLRARGLAFFGGDTQPPKASATNRYSPWRQSPLIFEDRRLARIDPQRPAEPLFALNAAGCRSSAHRGPMTPQDRAEDVERALRAPGSFYTVTGNGEGMIVVDPANGLAWFLYFG